MERSHSLVPVGWLLLPASAPASLPERLLALLTFLITHLLACLPFPPHRAKQEAGHPCKHFTSQSTFVCVYTYTHTHRLGRVADHFYTTVDKPKFLKHDVSLNGSLNATREEEAKWSRHMEGRVWAKCYSSAFGQADLVWGLRCVMVRKAVTLW